MCWTCKRFGFDQGDFPCSIGAGGPYILSARVMSSAVIPQLHMRLELSMFLKAVVLGKPMAACMHLAVSAPAICLQEYKALL